MIRRQRKRDVFSRQVSVGMGIAVEGPTSGVPVSIGGTTPILTYEGLLNSALASPAAPNFPNIVKGIQVLGFSWATDYLGEATSAGDQTPLTGAESFFVDRVTGIASGADYGSSIDVPGTEQTYLNRDQTGTQWQTISFPERTLHRRRFTVNALSADFLLGGASFVTGGFGTERHMRRRFTLKPYQGFFWRAEIYDVLVANAEQAVSVLGDLLGVVSFRVLT